MLLDRATGFYGQVQIAKQSTCKNVHLSEQGGCTCRPLALVQGKLIHWQNSMFTDSESSDQRRQVDVKQAGVKQSVSSTLNRLEPWTGGIGVTVAKQAA